MAKQRSLSSKQTTPDAPVTTVTDVTLPSATPAQANKTQGLSKGLWGIVGSNTRYSTVTQFSGLEYVRYEYRRIPEQFRDAAFASVFLEVVEVTEDLPAAELETVAPVELAEDLTLPAASASEDPKE